MGLSFDFCWHFHFFFFSLSLTPLHVFAAFDLSFLLLSLSLPSWVSALSSSFVLSVSLSSFFIFFFSLSLLIFYLQDPLLFHLWNSHGYCLGPENTIFLSKTFWVHVGACGCLITSNWICASTRETKREIANTGLKCLESFYRTMKISPTRLLHESGNRIWNEGDNKRDCKHGLEMFGELLPNKENVSHPLQHESGNWIWRIRFFSDKINCKCGSSLGD